MTREEAIKLLEHISIAYTPTDAYGDYDDPQPYEEAIDMAIEALSADAEPSADRYEEAYWDGFHDAERANHRWIPVEERLPEDDTLMLVNYIDNRPDAMDMWIGWHEMENVWYINGEAHSREYGNEVVAWMPLPEPFTREKDEPQTESRE